MIKARVSFSASRSITFVLPTHEENIESDSNTCISWVSKASASATFYFSELPSSLSFTASAQGHLEGIQTPHVPNSLIDHPRRPLRARELRRDTLALIP